MLIKLIGSGFIDIHLCFIIFHCLMSYYGPEIIQQQPSQVVYQQYETDEQRFQNIMGLYEIGDFYSSKLKQLVGFEIVLICDDSSSMRALVKGGSLGMTRWEELKRTASIVVDIAGLMDPTGIDIYFLNREPLFNVKYSAQVAPAFYNPPKGGTSISSILRQILESKQQKIKEQKLLIMIATDGLATNDQGDVDMGTLKFILKHERRPIDRICVTFLMCTDEKRIIKIYNRWDKKITNVDVVDDYQSEKLEIEKVCGHNHVFSFGDYVVKSLIGSVDRTIDHQDEKRCVIS